MRAKHLALFDLLAEDLAAHCGSRPGDPHHPSRGGGDCWVGSPIEYVASVSLLKSILKKYKEDGPGADQKALQKFLDSNERCNRSAPYDVRSLTCVDEAIIGEVKKELHSFFDDPERGCSLYLHKILEGAGWGPGASVGASGDSRYHKIGSSRITGTSKDLYRLYYSAVGESPTWLAAEKIRRDALGGFTLVRGSKLQYVPKSQDISRTICVEPLLNMFFQKGIGEVLRHRLVVQFGINLEHQPAKNRRLAKIGSRSGLLGTIDLQSASDLIALPLCEELLPATAMWWLRFARSPATVLPNGETIQLHMVSSMGNDFTFPLMTGLFASIVVATYRVLGIPVRLPRKERLGNFAVFGDDIIVYARAYPHVCRILEAFGFLVNHDKSYNEGPFRESCGADYFLGQDVRGVYCESLDTVHDIYSLINRLGAWSCNHGVKLERSLSYLWSLVPSKQRFPVPPWADVTTGITTPLSWAAWEGARWARSPWICRSTGSILYKGYQARAAEFPVSHYGDVQYTREGTTVHRTHIEVGGKKLLHNPPALMMCAVGGYLRAGYLTLRQRETRYKKRVLVSPGWDWQYPSGRLYSRQGWRRFLSGYAMPREVVAVAPPEGQAEREQEIKPASPEKCWTLEEVSYIIELALVELTRAREGVQPKG